MNMYVALFICIAHAFYLNIFHFYFSSSTLFLFYVTLLYIILYYSLDASFISEERKKWYGSGCGGGKRELVKIGRESLYYYIILKSIFNKRKNKNKAKFMEIYKYLAI